MSDETSKPKRVAFVTRDGQFGTVDASDAANMPHGTRILSAKEAKEREEDIAQQAAQAREDERYDKTPAAAKVLNGIATAASAVMPGAALTFGAGAAPGTAPAAYSSGVTEGLTGGARTGGHPARHRCDARKEVGDKYAQQVADQKVASPYAHGVGNVGAPVPASSLALAERPSSSRRRACTRWRASDVGARQGGRRSSEARRPRAPSRAASSAVASTRESNYPGPRRSRGQALRRSGRAHSTALELAPPSAVASPAGSGIKGGRWRSLSCSDSGSLAGEAESTARSLLAALVDDLGTEAGTKNGAYDQLFTQTGSGRGLQSSDFVKRADRYLENGTRDVAETWMRKGVFDPRAGIVDASRPGLPLQCYPSPRRLLAAVREIGDRTAQAEAAKGQEIMSAVEMRGEKYDYAATKVSRARSGRSDLEASVKARRLWVQDRNGLTPASNVNGMGSAAPRRRRPRPDRRAKGCRSDGVRQRWRRERHHRNQEGASLD